MVVRCSLSGDPGFGCVIVDFPRIPPSQLLIFACRWCNLLMMFFSVPALWVMKLHPQQAPLYVSKIIISPPFSMLHSKPKLTLVLSFLSSVAFGRSFGQQPTI